MIRNSFHLIHRFIICSSPTIGLSGLLAFAGFLSSSCDDASFRSSQIQFDNIQTAIDNKDYDKAQALIMAANNHTKNRNDERILMHNQAIVDILSGNCDKARQNLEILQNSELNDEDKLTQKIPKQIGSPVSDLHVKIHEAMVMALICPTDKSKQTSRQNYLMAITQLYHAIQNGRDLRDILGDIYLQMIPNCQALVPPQQPKFDSPQNASQLENSYGKIREFFLCPGPGAWFSFEARQYETLELTLNLRSLPRDLWPDDSSKLPYARIHVDLYDVNDLSVPEHSYIQPLPESLPNPEDYISQKIVLESYETQISGRKFVHFYTENHGEARILPEFERSIDCSHLDDEYTYSHDLKQTVFELKPDETVTNLVLCPSRPDKYQFRLEPGQIGLVTFMSNAPIHYQNDKINIALVDEKNYKLPEVSSPEQEKTIKTPHYQVMQNVFMLENEKFSRNFLIFLVHNTQKISHTYTLTVNNNDSTSLQHSISYNVSQPCSDKKNSAETEPVPIVFDQSSNHFLIPTPRFACPGEDIYFRPVLPKGKQSWHSKIVSTVISPNSWAEDDYSLQTLLNMTPDNQDIVREIAAVQNNNLWIAPHPMFERVLQKPFLNHSLIKAHLSDSLSGFVILVAYPSSSDENTDNQNKQNKEEKQQKDQKKEQKDQSKDEDKPDPTPEKPSETPATPEGDGTDTQGNESTPEDSKPGKDAEQFDPDQVERAHIDALLDTFEQGNYNIPLPGEINETTHDKDW